MTSFLRHHSSFVGIIGTGLFIGLGGTLLYVKITNKFVEEIRKLNATISVLRNELQELKDKLPSKRRRRHPGFYSVHASSGDDDDDQFEEAFEAFSGSTSVSEFESVASFPQLSDPDIVEDINFRRNSTQDDRENLFSKVDNLLEGEDKKTALTLLEEAESKYLTDAELHWRLAKAKYQVSQIEGAQGNEDRKKGLVYSSLESARKAVTLNDDCANAHKWYAITIGSIGDYEGTQEKIKNGYTFKDHIEKAVALNPNDPSNHYLLGRWCFGVYMLSWLERKAAAALFSNPPSATVDEALNEFLQAEKLNPGKWKENTLFIAKCYIQKRSYIQAVEWLEKAQAIPSVSQDDKNAEEEIQQLLAKYR